MKKILIGLTIVGAGYLVLSRAQNTDDDVFYDAISDDMVVRVPGESRTINLSKADDMIADDTIANAYNDPDREMGPLRFAEVAYSDNKGKTRHKYYEMSGLQNWFKYNDRSPDEYAPITRESTRVYEINTVAGDPEIKVIELADVLPQFGVVLDLSDGKFNEVDLANKSEEELAQVAYLNLANNGLGSIPTVLQKMSNLRRLNLANNEIAGYWEMPYFERLTYLNLDYNKLSGFNGMPDFPALESLFINNNYIVDFNSMPYLPALKFLSVSNANPTAAQLITHAAEYYRTNNPGVTVDV